MKDKSDTIFAIFIILMVILSIVSAILILTSDLPWWLKYLLLKSYTNPP